MVRLSSTIREPLPFGTTISALEQIPGGLQDAIPVVYNCRKYPASHDFMRS